MARPKNEIERRQIGLRLRSDVMRAVRHLSVDLDMHFNILVEEAVEDLLRKYGRQCETYVIDENVKSPLVDKS